MTTPKESFEISFTLKQRITGIDKSHLSLSRYSNLQKKNLVSKSNKATGRTNPIDHLNRLFEEKRIHDRKKPLMLISVRNVISNLRCMGYIAGRTEEGPITVAQESEDTNRRPYFILGEHNSALTMRRYRAKQGDERGFSWFFSGVPVLWDCSDTQLFKMIVAEASDHSHVYHLPRGNHPDRDRESTKHWRELQAIFEQSQSASYDEAAGRIVSYAKENGLRRESTYSHSILGIDKKGILYQLIGLGRLEALGKEMKAMGAYRALAVDNSGSTVVQFYPDGIDGEMIQVFAAPNHRKPGTAYLILELNSSSFLNSSFHGSSS